MKTLSRAALLATALFYLVGCSASNSLPAVESASSVASLRLGPAMLCTNQSGMNHMVKPLVDTGGVATGDNACQGAGSHSAR